MSINVLVIDDTESDHDLCVEYLSNKAKDYQFLHAYSGEQGLELYHQHAVDCILLDYHLQDMNGLDVLKLLGEGNRIVPVIMMTGEGNETIAVAAMKLGSQDYIPKKVVSASALTRAVEHATERADLLRKMEQYRKDLERSNRDLEQFATIVAHDLKSPLRAVTQHLALLKQKNAGQLDEKSLRSLDFAVDGADRMRELIEALFTYARLGFCEPVMGMINLESVLENVRHDLSVTIEETNALVTSDPLPDVFGDPVLLAELFQNLIGNALKYCKGAPLVHISASMENGYWRIGISDNGIGIPQEQEDKIFSIFRRLHADGDYPGIGLGLAVCERILRLHGGKIWVTSIPGKGSTFYFTLAAMPLTK